MPRKPNATSPNANTAGASMMASSPFWLTKYDAPMRVTTITPIQNALKLPAVRPDRMLSEAPPSRDDATTSFTWADSVEVNTLMSSGMIAPASVPHEMMSESFHQSVPSPSVGMSRYETMKVAAIEMNEVSHTSTVSGVSKLNAGALPILPFW